MTTEPTSEFLTLSLGKGVDQSAAEDLATALTTIDQVKSARALQMRAIDPHSAMVLVEFVGGVLGGVTAVWDLVTRLRTVLGNDRVRGARVTLPNGARIELESVTRDDLAHVVELAGATPPELDVAP
jgi:hypothetical protein